MVEFELAWPSSDSDSDRAEADALRASAPAPAPSRSMPGSRRSRVSTPGSRRSEATRPNKSGSSQQDETIVLDGSDDGGYFGVGEDEAAHGILTWNGALDGGDISLGEDASADVPHPKRSRVTSDGMRGSRASSPVTPPRTSRRAPPGSAGSVVDLTLSSPDSAKKTAPAARKVVQSRRAAQIHRSAVAQNKRNRVAAVQPASTTARGNPASSAAHDRVAARSSRLQTARVSSPSARAPTPPSLAAGSPIRVHEDSVAVRPRQVAQVGRRAVLGRSSSDSQGELAARRRKRNEDRESAALSAKMRKHVIKRRGGGFGKAGEEVTIALSHQAYESEIGFRLKESLVGHERLSKLSVAVDGSPEGRRMSFVSWRRHEKQLDGTISDSWRPFNLSVVLWSGAEFCACLAAEQREPGAGRKRVAEELTAMLSEFPPGIRVLVFVCDVASALESVMDRHTKVRALHTNGRSTVMTHNSMPLLIGQANMLSPTGAAPVTSKSIDSCLTWLHVVYDLEVEVLRGVSDVVEAIVLLTTQMCNLNIAAVPSDLSFASRKSSDKVETRWQALRSRGLPQQRPSAVPKATLIWARQLACIPGLSETSATNIAWVYPTPRSLFSVYRSRTIPDAQKQNLLMSIIDMRTQQRKKSFTVYRYFTAMDGAAPA